MTWCREARAGSPAVKAAGSPILHTHASGEPSWPLPRGPAPSTVSVWAQCGGRAPCTSHARQLGPAQGNAPQATTWETPGHSAMEGENARLWVGGPVPPICAPPASAFLHQVRKESRRGLRQKLSDLARLNVTGRASATQSVTPDKASLVGLLDQECLSRFRSLTYKLVSKKQLIISDGQGVKRLEKGKGWHQAHLLSGAHVAVRPTDWCGATGCPACLRSTCWLTPL